MKGFVTIAALLLVLGAGMSTPAVAQVDFGGQWAPLYHEDTIERIPGPELGDYTGLPLNEAARLRADSWDADRIRWCRSINAGRTRPTTRCAGSRRCASPPITIRLLRGSSRSTPTSAPTRTGARFTWMDAPIRPITRRTRSRDSRREHGMATC